MPIVNTKNSNKENVISDTNFDFINKEKKSGSVTLDPRLKVKNKELKNTLPKKLDISKKKKESYNSIFNDNDIIIFKEINVNINTNLSTSDPKNNLIISSNNTFDLNTFTSNRDVLPTHYDYYLSDTQEILYEQDAFDENTTFYQNNTGDFANEEEIEIDIEFDIPCILSNNRIFNPNTVASDIKYEYLNSIKFPIKIENSEVVETLNVKRHTSPTAYFNFVDNRWDYLGNIKKPTYLEDSSSFNSYANSQPFSFGVQHVPFEINFDANCDDYEAFSEITNYEDKIENVLLSNYTCFSGVTNDYSQNSFKRETYVSAIPGPSTDDIMNKHNGPVGSPISNYGFPHSGKYEPLDSHKIKLKDYIHKDFYLKKVIFDGEFTSFVPGRAEITGDSVDATQLVNNKKYRVIEEGNTSWSSVGAGNHFNYVDVQFTASGPAQSATPNGKAKELNDSGLRLGINNVSFFLINNRKNLNENYYNNLDRDIEDQQTNCITWDYSNLDLNGDPVSLISKSFPRLASKSKQFELSDADGDRRKFSFLDENNSYKNTTQSNNETINHLIYFPTIQQGETTKSSSIEQRELITYNNIVNFCSGSIDKSDKYFCVDYDNVKNESDIFLELSPFYTNSTNQITGEKDNTSGYYKKNIQINSKVKSATIQNDYSVYSHFPILTSNKHGKRSLYSFNSGRSSKNEIHSDSLDDSVNSGAKLNSIMTKNTPADETDLDISVSNYKNTYFNDEYILKPEDEITLGVSLTSSFNNFNGRNGNLGDDVFIVHKLKAKLIGSYKRKGEKLTSKKRIDNNNIINRSIIGNNDLTDESFTTPAQLNSNYYTREYSRHGLSSLYTNKGEVLEKSVKHFVSLGEEGEKYIQDSLMNNVLDVIAADGKKLIDEDWPDHSSYSLSSYLNGYMLVVPSNHANPTEYENEKWTDSYPFEDKYDNIKRITSINYKKLKIKGIADTIGVTQTDDEIPVTVAFPNNPLFDNITSNIQNYFYSFNRGNPNKTRMPIAVKTSGSGVNYLWYNNNYNFVIDGFRYGVLNPNSITNNIMFSNKKYGNFSDKINSNKNYATTNRDGSILYSVIKKFYIDFMPEDDVSNLNNTYNKDFYARSEKPFFDTSN